MYLSQLEIVGFKSFAQKINVKFNDGITAIVGPNGCGKSNIVDALRWVLGEQKSSVLRSDKMGDVIFNGTKHRRPLGMSEVSLTIENTKGILPTEYSEVTITRRLFRNGESQYLLNKTACRLRDIVDLFMDTGMGADAYSVIELKMIENILSDKAHERRHLFEEASGVTKYKLRRKEAERKLEATQTDLSRVQDIIAEVQKSVRSLQRQATKAQKYKETDDEIKRTERKLLAREYLNLRSDIEPIERSIAEHKTTKHTAEQTMIAQESVVTELEQQQADVAERLAQAEQSYNLRSRESANYTRESAVVRERIGSLERSVERMRAEHEELTETLVRLDEQILTAEQRAVAKRAERTESENDFHMAKSVHDTAQNGVREARTVANNANAAVMKALQDINAMQSQVERSKAQADALRKRITETQEAMERAHQEITALTAKHDELVTAGTAFDANIQSAEKGLAGAQERQTALRSEQDELQNTISAMQAEIGKKVASLEFLQGLVDTGESGQFLLKHQAWASTARPILLAEAIGAEERVRVAVDSALGEAGRMMVVPTAHDAFAGMHHLKQSGKGKATFVCLERVPVLPPPPPAPHDPRVIGWVSEVIFADEPLRHAVRGLIGAVMMTDTIEHAEALIREGLAERVVTLDGELISHHGVVRGGGRTKTEGAFIGKRDEIARLHAEIEQLQSQLKDLRARLAERSQEYRTINLSVYSNAIRSAESERSRHQQAIAQVEYRKQSLQNTIEHSTKDIARFAEDILRTEQAGLSAQTMIEELHDKKEFAERSAAEAQKSLREADAHLQQLSEQFRTQELRLQQIRNDVQGIENDINRVRTERQHAERRREQRTQEIERSTAEVQELHDSSSELMEKVTLSSQAVQEAEVLRNDILEEQNTLRKTVQAEAESFRLQRKQYDDVQSTLHTLQLQLNDLHNRLHACTRKAKEDYDVDLHSAARELKRRMKAMADDGQSHASSAEESSSALHADDHDPLVEEFDGEEMILTTEEISVEEEDYTGMTDEEIRVRKAQREEERHARIEAERAEEERRIAVARAQAFAEELLTKLASGEESVEVQSDRERVKKLKQELSGMGAVNLLAFEEYQRESERLKFLESQFRDLQEADATIRQTIDEINMTAKQKFTETFEQIRTNFNRIFKTLFEPGDESDLTLEDGDPLEAHVNIMAKPRGKRPHSVEMLSGGEKTLTAIALLFAIYLVKPSPFCILDEVDAPLDDANVDRYVRLIREFSVNTQFIMITHNKRTMEAADTMYGVTMEEEGVSRLVSVQFDRETK